MATRLGCKTEVFRYKKRKSFDNAETDVTIDKGRIRLNYRDDRGQPFEYEGAYDPRGPSKLTCKKSKGKSTIYHFRDRDIFAGLWEEDWHGREYGFRSIDLKTAKHARDA